MTTEIKDSGQRQQFHTGSQRDTRDGKGRFDLVSWYAIMRLARIYEGGAKKYDDHNWRKGQPLSRYMDSAFRHLAKHAMGWRDEDHMAMCMWNVAGFMETEERIRNGQLPETLDDMHAWTPPDTTDPVDRFMEALKHDESLTKP